MSSANSFSTSYAQAMLPTRGMAFAGAGNAHVHDWLASRSTVTALQPHAVNTQLGSSYPSANTTGGTTSANGSISGGLLRPGAIAQPQFQAMLNAASAGVPGASPGGSALPMSPSSGLLPLAPNAALAAQGLQPASAANFAELSAAAASGASGNLRNLTPAQFAAMTGGATLPGAATPPSQIPVNQTPLGQIPVNQPPFSQIPTGQQVQQSPQQPAGLPMPQQIAMANNLTLSDAAIPADNPGQGQQQVAAAAPTPNSLTLSDASIPADNPGQNQPAAAAAPTPNPNDLTLSDASIPADDVAPQQQASASDNADSSDADAKAAADAALIGHTDKNGVLVLNMAPDHDTRLEYKEKGIKWRLVDNPASDKLFFGKDGKLGWDDVLDLINPLQHIPLVNIAYRHFTGDQISGSAELLGAIPFGPVATLAAIADLAVKSTTGKDIGENVIAMITGDHDDDASNLAQAPAGTTTPAGTTADPTTGTAASAASTNSADQVASVESDADYNHAYGRG